MKCPKCGYLGLDEPSRCRHCGYEFSLSESVDLSDLAMRPHGDSALPLFTPGIDDDTPLITRPSPPRAPLAVRRSTPDMPRLRSTTPRSVNLDLELGGDDRLEARGTSSPSNPESHDWVARPGEDASVIRRVGAAVVDSAILVAIDLAVIYFTMQICSVPISELGLLPKGPLATFLLVQNVGYLVAFTAGGQTLGKMAAGVKIVPADSSEPLDMNCALKRTAAWLLLAFPAGLGLLSACFSHDHRGLHDRFAGTRVVRASA